MKKIFFSLFTLISVSLSAQTTAELFQDNDYSYTWLGVDYSHVKLIGPFAQFNEGGVAGPELIQSKYFPAWNGLYVSESEKYNVYKIFNRTSMDYNMDAINLHNEQASASDMESTTHPNYTEDDIKKFATEIDYKVDNGYGVMMVCEYLNKNTVLGKFHLVVINLATKEVLLVHSMEGKAGGFGLRAYWATPMKRLIDDSIARSKKWKKEFSGKK